MKFHAAAPLALGCLAALAAPAGASPPPAHPAAAAKAVPPAQAARPATPTSPAPASPPLVDRIGPTGFLEVAAPSWAGLPLRQKLVAFHLARAAIQLDPVFYAQMSSYGLPAKRLLGALVEDPGRLPPESRAKILEYAKLFFANHGNHNEVTGRKFLPAFTAAELGRAAEQARARGARLGSAAQLAAVLRELAAPLFDPGYQPALTDKNPAHGADILAASSNTYYQGVTIADLAGFAERYPLDSTLIKRSGRLAEEVWRAGTPDGKVPAGRYAAELTAVGRELAAAAGYADAGQAAALRALVRFYQTGEPADWRAYNVAWLRSDPVVDFASGFIEVYRDARGAKGSAQMLVSVTDQRRNALMHRLADNAVYFEKRAPWDERFKKLDVKPPVGKAIEVVIETGDFSVGTIGDNLPNEQEVREKYGTKSLLMTSVLDAFNAARGARVAVEFSPNADEAQLFARYGDVAGSLQTAMHEVIGHGSGKVLVPKDPSTYLREYYSTLEEARADLVSYWDATDPKLAELGVADGREVAREIYRGLARLGLTTLNHYPKGSTVEEDHDRGRLLIANYAIAAGALAQVRRNRHWYIEVKDYDRLHAVVGKLLAEIMRIKAQGDYAAIKALVDKYGAHFDPAVRDDVIARYQRLDTPSYWIGVYPVLRLVQGSDGKVTDVAVGYRHDFLAQALEYAAANGTLGWRR
ncbi:MAG TPA: peptidase [Thermoanaerobaculia bacterium]|nr:peptidase [Thermoanaerobaculia bacterium]